MMRLLFLLLILFTCQLGFAFACDNPQPIIQKPVLFGEKRISLTRDYQAKHYGIYHRSILIEPKMIVLHWSMYPTFTSTYKAFYAEELSHQIRPDLPGNLNISAQFVVDRDGTIYQLMPDNWTARHVVGMNHYAIGIENVGGVYDKPDLTPAQVKANAFLVCYLKKKYPSIRYLIGHMDYLKFKNTPLWLEKDNYSHPLHKKDPGENFMREVRGLTKHLHLQSSFSS